MTDPSTIQAQIVALEARTNRLAGYAFVHLLCGSDGWSVSCNSLRIHLRGFVCSFEALAAMDAALAKIEDRDGALARTLGVEAA